MYQQQLMMLLRGVELVAEGFTLIQMATRIEPPQRTNVLMRSSRKLPPRKPV